MTSASSLLLIAAGAVLAFAVSYEVAGINIKTIGVILIVVGGIGLAFAMATLAGYAPWGANRAVAAAAQPPASVAVANNVAPPATVAPPTSATPPSNV